MKLPTELFSVQNTIWPSSGRHILAHYDESTVIVYQAYRPSIGLYAIKHQKFGGPDFSLSRMSWIKPNFLWMMYRSGWGTKEGQEITLGLRIGINFFDSLLESAVASTHDERIYRSRAEWKSALEPSNVRLQWDPDHTPNGSKTERRAIQLGLRGDVLLAFSSRELLEVIDMTDFVRSQQSLLQTRGESSLTTPRERVYLPASDKAKYQVGID